MNKGKCLSFFVFKHVHRVKRLVDVGLGLKNGITISLKRLVKFFIGVVAIPMTTIFLQKKNVKKRVVKKVAIFFILEISDWILVISS